MAICHIESKVISRSQGRSSVAASSYRACERIVDERTALVHDFTKKGDDLLHKEILLPDNAPEWMGKRDALWNAVEAVEKRKDSQLSREVVVSLPRELTDKQNIELAREFAKEAFVNRGMIADVCIHSGHKSTEKQPHAHIMLSMREISEKGFGKKVREWNDKALLMEWRETWANTCNRHLALNGHDMRIDHRSNEAQGINLEPQTKIGPKIASDRMAKFAEHQHIAHENGTRILEDPKIALNAITKQQSTFTHSDLARFVNRHSDSREQFIEVFEKVKSSPEMVSLGQDLKNNDRFTTKEMVNLEYKMITSALSCASSFNHQVSNSIQNKVLQQSSLNDSQEIAFRHIVDKGDAACVAGFAGTGKSYMLGAAKEAWEAQGYNVKGMTLAKIAANNLESESGIKSHTIANRLINWKNDREKLSHRDIVVVDEAGMVGSGQMAKIVEEVKDANAKLVLVGDWEQLQAIDAGASFRAIAQKTGFVEMNDILRQKEEWQRDATKNFALSKTMDGLTAYDKHSLLHSFDTKKDAINSMLESWQEVRSNNPEQTQLLLAYTRADVKDLNNKARSIRKENGELGEAHILETHNGNKEFSINDKIIFLRNEKSLELSNGSIGTIKGIENDRVIIELDKASGEQNKTVSFSTKFYNNLDHGYASTIHKNQGSTVDRTHVLASKYLDRHATYVAMSRHRDSCELYWSKDTFKDTDSLANSLSRERLKDTTLDYTQNRSIDQREETKDPQITTNNYTTTNVQADAARARLQARAFNNDLNELQRDIEKPISQTLHDRDKGIFRGTVELGGRTYGLLEQDRQIKLLSNSMCNNLTSGKEYEVTRSTDPEKERSLEIKAPEIERSRGMELSR